MCLGVHIAGTSVAFHFRVQNFTIVDCPHHNPASITRQVNGPHLGGAAFTAAWPRYFDPRTVCSLLFNCIVATREPLIGKLFTCTNTRVHPPRNHLPSTLTSSLLICSLLHVRPGPNDCLEEVQPELTHDPLVGVGQSAVLWDAQHSHLPAYHLPLGGVIQEGKMVPSKSLKNLSKGDRNGMERNRKSGHN